MSLVEKLYNEYITLLNMYEEYSNTISAINHKPSNNNYIQIALVNTQLNLIRRVVDKDTLVVWDKDYYSHE